VKYRLNVITGYQEGLCQLKQEKLEGGMNCIMCFQDLHPEPDIFRMIHTRKVRWLEHVTHRILIGNCGAKG